ncbi:serine/arginine repetitive matrix protein 2-like [Diachasma alloeum]|uniref:serine/arginine repetitive matrix protein 2-like n=1 Tax=Diachasma alloeum TaxID=454923 RepID=UPI0010FB8953|nr:serine/arginine repetitive matrix protein 2-like [Diachasma alloeum]
MMLRAFMEGDHRRWDTHLHKFRFAFNTVEHSSIQTSPAFANFGRNPLAAVSLRRELEGDVEIIPGEPQEWVERMRKLEMLRKILIHAMRESADKQAHHYNLRRRDVEFQEGDLFMRRSLSNAVKRFSATLVPPFEGPFVVHKKNSSPEVTTTTEAECLTVDLTGSPPPSPPLGLETKDEPAPTTSQQAALLNAQLALECVLFQEGIPVEDLDDYSFLEEEVVEQLGSPPCPQRYSPETEAITPPSTAALVRPNQERTPPREQPGSPLRFPRFWDPIGPWLADIRSIEKTNPGFADALSTCSLAPLQQLTRWRYEIPPLPLGFLEITTTEEREEVVIPDVPSVAQFEDPTVSSVPDLTSELSDILPAPSSPRIPDSQSSSSSSSSFSSSSSSSSNSSSSVETCLEPEDGDPVRQPGLGESVKSLSHPSSGAEVPQVTSIWSCESNVIEFIELDNQEEFSLASTTPGPTSPHPTPSAPKVESSLPNPLLTSTRVSEKAHPGQSPEVRDGQRTSARATLDMPPAVTPSSPPTKEPQERTARPLRLSPLPTHHRLFRVTPEDPVIGKPPTIKKGLGPSAIGGNKASPKEEKDVSRGHGALTVASTVIHTRYVPTQPGTPFAISAPPDSVPTRGVRSTGLWPTPGPGRKPPKLTSAAEDCRPPLEAVPRNHSVGPAPSTGATPRRSRSGSQGPNREHPRVGEPRERSRPRSPPRASHERF